MQDVLRVGVITGTHGLKGEVKVFPTTDDPKRFKDLKEVLLYTDKDILPLKITGVKFTKNLVVLKFKGFETIEEAEKLKKKELFISRENAVPLEEGEYFIVDLIGLQVVTDDGILLGTLTDVIQTGANDVYVVEGSDKKEILLPAIRECILNTDLEKKIMTVKIPEGLMD
ncbi:ribosome maturation factor RimM [Parasporobacterium paucivorans]|uniref:Ribosome maturation factor RimM n=1 Tax=Parasporobacterium paucivorans DSM 15970 TaxID=1122934 RepID=A0A1M5ZZV1_9FIRM|nr:ribosome maturation factor RimM [Parasporobacterium paucivorans]SHI29730.1 16S rRNA processing protein RimM [Parasporobacterium paucivorans DSM 15970]